MKYAGSICSERALTVRRAKGSSTNRTFIVLGFWASMVFEVANEK